MANAVLLWIDIVIRRFTPGFRGINRPRENCPYSHETIAILPIQAVNLSDFAN